MRDLAAIFGPASAVGLPDDQLLQRFRDRKAGLEEAFRLLVTRHGNLVWHTCRGVLGEADTAEDAFQATFAVLARRAGSIRLSESGSLGPWLHGVARRVALAARRRRDQRRRRERTRGDHHEGVDRTSDPSTIAGRAEAIGLLREELGRLPEPLRSVVVLCDLEGFSHARASEQLGVPVGTVKSRQARARERLRDRLARRGLASGLVGLGSVRASMLAEAVPASVVARTTSWITTHPDVSLGIASSLTATLPHGGSLMTPWLLKTTTTLTFLATTTLAGSTLQDDVPRVTDPAILPQTIVRAESQEGRPESDPPLPSAPSNDDELAEESRKLVQAKNELEAKIQLLEEQIDTANNEVLQLRSQQIRLERDESQETDDRNAESADVGESDETTLSNEEATRETKHELISNQFIQASSDDGRLVISARRLAQDGRQDRRFQLWSQNKGDVPLENMLITIRSTGSDTLEASETQLFFLESGRSRRAGVKGRELWTYDKDVDLFVTMNPIRLEPGQLSFTKFTFSPRSRSHSRDAQDISLEVRGYARIAETLNRVATPSAILTGANSMLELKTSLIWTEASDRSSTSQVVETGRVGNLVVVVKNPELSLMPRSNLRVAIDVAGNLQLLDMKRPNTEPERDRIDREISRSADDEKERVLKKPRLVAGESWDTVIDFVTTEPGSAAIRCVLTYDDQPENVSIEKFAHIVVVPASESIGDDESSER